MRAGTCRSEQKSAVDAWVAVKAVATGATLAGEGAAPSVAATGVASEDPGGDGVRVRWGRDVSLAVGIPARLRAQAEVTESTRIRPRSLVTDLRMWPCLAGNRGVACKARLYRAAKGYRVPGTS